MDHQNNDEQAKLKLGVGEYLDVEELLMKKSVSKALFRYSDGKLVDIQILRGKYLVIRCFSLPVKDVYPLLWDCHAAMIAAYPELVKRSNSGFEMVTIVKMDKDDRAAFDDFLSTIPGLTVPFDDSDSRTFVCETLSLCRTQPGPLAGVVLDKCYRVMHNHLCERSFAHYGAAFFPFTDARADALAATKAALRRRLDYWNLDDNTSGSLMDLLSCEPCHKLKSLGGGDEEISVEELSKKNCVGVYLCVTTSLLPQLASVYKECKAHNLEFEIVVSCQSWSYFHEPLDDEEFKEIASEFESTSSWWILEWSDASSRRLRDLCYNYTIENLIMVRPYGKFWDKRGKSKLLSGGIDSYPFTEEGILERMASLTIESVLSDSDDPNLMTHLRGKNVLVYVGRGRSKKGDESCVLDTLRHIWNNNNNGNYSDLQVVFVSAGGHDASDLTSTELSQWHVLPSVVSDKVIRKVFTQTELDDWFMRTNTIVAFGKDGRICSRYAQNHLDSLFAEMPEDEADDLKKKVKDHCNRVSGEFENEEPLMPFD